DRFDRREATGPHGLPVTYWVRPVDTADMTAIVERLPTMLGWLEQHFGPYPFSSAGVVVVPDRSAMETQSMVMMGRLTGYRGETVLLHELAHQWFGDAVTPRTWLDLWLNEGFATYAELMYSVERLHLDLAGTLRGWYDADQRLRNRAGPPG